MTISYLKSWAKELKLAAPLDYETEDAYSIRVEGTDSGGLSVQKALTINVENRNEPPNIAIDNNKIAEDASVGLRIGKVSGSDPERSKVTVVMSPDDENIDNELFTFSKGHSIQKAPTTRRGPS